MLRRSYESRVIAQNRVCGNTRSHLAQAGSLPSPDESRNGSALKNNAEGHFRIMWQTVYTEHYVQYLFCFAGTKLRLQDL